MKNEKNSFLTEKKIKIKKVPSKVNIKKNIPLMNLPEFHFNKTIKAYINTKLSQNKNPINKAKIMNKSPKKINLKRRQKFIDDNFQKTFTRINTVSNFHKTKKIFSKNYEKKLKESPIPKVVKKMYKSISRPKLNLSNYIMKSRKKSNNKQRNIDNLFSDNSSHKLHRYTGSTTLSNTGTNQIADKTISIYQQGNNQIFSDNSTIDLIKNKNSNQYMQTTSKKSKFSNKYFHENNNIHIKFSKLNKLKENNGNNKILKIKESNIKNKSLNNLDNIDNGSLNYINKTENNILYTKLDKDYLTASNNNYKQISNFNNNIKLAKQQNENYTPEKPKQKNIFLNDMNYQSSNENIININNDSYIKKIEMLENENKLLKNEVNYSKNKLQLLEDKINLLLTGKCIIINEKEECPQPTPYVKKYSSEISENLNSQSNIDVNNNREIYHKIIKNKKMN